MKFKLSDYKFKNGKHSVYLIHFYNKKKFKCSTGIRVLPKDWDAKKERIKLSTPYAEEDNDRLTYIEREFSKIRAKDNKGYKNAMQKIMEAPNSEDFFEFAYKDNERLSISTRKNFDGLVNRLMEFQAVFGQITFNSFDQAFYDQFKNYCMNDLKYSDSTFASRISSLKVILRNAERQGIKVNAQFKDFKVIGYYHDSIYLSEGEIKQIKDAKMPPQLDQIRDAFVIRCYVGTRFSDSDISRNNVVEIEGVKLFKIFTQKTMKDVFIPIHPIVEQLMEKNYWRLKSVSNKHANVKIKEICRRAGITQKVVISKKRGGKTELIEYEKYELVTTHTARRSVATNMYLSGIDPTLILPITGHSTIKQLLTYIRADNLSKALMVAKNKFFK